MQQLIFCSSSAGNGDGHSNQATPIGSVTSGNGATDNSSLKTAIILPLSEVIASVESRLCSSESQQSTCHIERGTESTIKTSATGKIFRKKKITTSSDTPSFSSKKLIILSKLSTPKLLSYQGSNIISQPKIIQEKPNSSKVYQKKVKSIINKLIDSEKDKNSHNVAVTSSKINPEMEKADIISDPENRMNPLGIQMLSKGLYEQIFKYSNKEDSSSEASIKDSIKLSKAHLKKQKLWGKTNSVQKNVELPLPELYGESLNEHFQIIAEEQCSPYKKLLHLLTHSTPPPVPIQFVFEQGWTKYFSDGSHSSVEAPDCQAFVFDVEVCVQRGSHPTLATAMSDKYWYSWCSKQLMNAEPVETPLKDTTPKIQDANSSSSTATEISKDEKIEEESDASELRQKSKLNLDELIPFEGSTEETKGLHKIIVGHNVSYDRIRIKEEYYVPGNNVRFLDTMSMHIAVSGLVQEQRAMIVKNNATSEKKVHLPWMSVGCLNNLNNVYKFYCKTDGLPKHKRNVFVSGSLEDIRSDFQNLMAYCATDVQATHRVLLNLLPQFYDRFPHPVTLAGVLEMGSSYLPVNRNWEKYLDAAESAYDTMRGALTEKLSERATEALSLQDDHGYLRDPWLWNLDWQVSNKMKKSGRNFPNWYVKLCKIPSSRGEDTDASAFMPHDMSTSLRVVPRLLRLTWRGYPLHHEKDHGWGYLRPTYASYEEFETHHETRDSAEKNIHAAFPVEELYTMSPPSRKGAGGTLPPETDGDWEQLLYGAVRPPKVS